MKGACTVASWIKLGFWSSSSLSGEPGIDMRGTGTVMLMTDNASPRSGRDGIVFRCVLMVIVVFKPERKHQHNLLLGYMPSTRI